MRRSSCFREWWRTFHIPFVASQRRGNPHEKGFTLIEMLVVIALVGIVVSGAAVSVATVFKSTDITNARNIALRQVQNVGFWITRDVLMATEPPIPGPNNGFPLSVEYDDWNGSNFESKTVVYSFDGKKLKRQVTNGTTFLIAEYIDTANTSFVPDGTNKYKLTVQASVSKAFSNATEKRTYEISRRLGP